MPNISIGKVTEIDEVFKTPSNRFIQTITIQENDRVDTFLNFYDRNIDLLKNIHIGDEVQAEYQHYGVKKNGKKITNLIGHGIKKINGR